MLDERVEREAAKIRAEWSEEDFLRRLLGLSPSRVVAKLVGDYPHVFARLHKAKTPALLQRPSMTEDAGFENAARVWEDEQGWWEAVEE